MRLVLGAMTSLLALAIGVGAAGAQVRNRRMPSGEVVPGRIQELPAQRPTPPIPVDTSDGGCVSTITRTVRLDPSSRVTIDYIRAHAPEVIVAMAQSVRQGKAPASALAELGSPELVRQVIATDWSAVLPADGAPEPTSSLTAMRLSQREAPACADAPPGTVLEGPRHFEGSARLGAASPGARAARLPTDDAAAAMMSQLMQLDITPGRIDMGSVLVGQRRRASFRVLSFAGGTLSVRAAPGSPVHVISVAPHDSELEASATGAQLHSARTAEQASLRGLALQPGQSADVLVEFNPRPQDGFDGSPRPYDASLDVLMTPADASASATALRIGPGDSRLGVRDVAERKVALHAIVAGRLYGIGVAMDTPRVYADAKMTFPVTFDWYNNGVAGDATLAVDLASLPSGVTVSGPASVSLHLEPGEEKPWGHLTFNGPAEYPPGNPTNSWDLPSPDQEPKITFTLSQSSAQGAQTSRYTVPVHIGGISTWYIFDDWSHFPKRADVYHHYYVRLSTDGSYMTFITVGASDYQNDQSCYRYFDSTTVSIDPFDVFSNAAVFHNGNFGIKTYYDAGAAGGLRANYDDTVKGFHASYRVSCEHHDY